MTVYAQGKAHKRPGKTYQLTLRLTLSKETIYNNQKQKTNNKKNKQTLGKGKI